MMEWKDGSMRYVSNEMGIMRMLLCWLDVTAQGGTSFLWAVLAKTHF